MLSGKFDVYIGMDEDYSENPKCPDGPYLEYDGRDLTSGLQWPGGFEAWCGLEGKYVTLERHPDAVSID